MAIIYIITNILNDKQYIGKTIRSFDVRLSEHIRGDNDTYFQHALAKYGVNNFHVECLEVSDGLASLWEKHLIKRWGSKAPNGYNLTDGGEGTVGHKHTKESKERISNYKTGRVADKCPNSKRWIITTPEGKDIEIISLTNFCNENNLSQGCMSMVAHGKRGHHRGYRCQIKESIVNG